jgi:hypothetical protein
MHPGMHIRSSVIYSFCFNQKGNDVKLKFSKD